MHINESKLDYDKKFMILSASFVSQTRTAPCRSKQRILRYQMTCSQNDEEEFPRLLERLFVWGSGSRRRCQAQSPCPLLGLVWLGWSWWWRRTTRHQRQGVPPLRTGVEGENWRTIRKRGVASRSYGDCAYDSGELILWWCYSELPTRQAEKLASPRSWPRSSVGTALD